MQVSLCYRVPGGEVNRPNRYISLKDGDSSHSTLCPILLNRGLFGELDTALYEHGRSSACSARWVVGFDQIVSADVKVGSGAEMGFRNHKYVDVVSFDDVLNFGFASLQAV